MKVVKKGGGVWGVGVWGRKREVAWIAEAARAYSYRPLGGWSEEKLPHDLTYASRLPHRRLTMYTVSTGLRCVYRGCDFCSIEAMYLPGVDPGLISRDCSDLVIPDHLFIVT